MSQAASPTIVLADDDAAVRAALRFSLELEGFRVVVRESGEAVLETPLPPETACLLLDLNMGTTSGLEALAELRRQGMAAPAILITSHPKAATRRAAAEAGVPIVEKPLMGEALLHAIRRAVAATPAV